MCVYFVVWGHNLRMKVLWSQHSQMTSPFALINPWLLLQLKSLSLIMSMGHMFLKVLNLLYHCCGTSHYVGLLVQIYWVWQAVYTYESNEWCGCVALISNIACAIDMCRGLFPGFAASCAVSSGWLQCVHFQLWTNGLWQNSYHGKCWFFAQYWWK